MTRWWNKLGTIYYDQKYEKDELMCFDKFKDIIKYYPFNYFKCDNCLKNINPSETFFLYI